MKLYQTTYTQTDYLRLPGSFPGGTSGAGTPVRSGLWTRLRNWIIRERKLRRDTAHLAQLDARLLKDIGLERHDLRGQLRRGRDVYWEFRP